MKTCPFLALLALAANASLPAAAAEAARDRQLREDIAATFKQLDRDGDGRLAGPELAQPAWLQRLDADQNGAVTLEEVQAQLALLARLARPKEPATAPAAATPPAFAPEDSPRQGPKRLKPGEHGIGAMMPDVSFTDLDGKTARLGEYQAGKPLVIALVSPSCPVSKRGAPSLAQLEREYRAKGVGFLLVAPTATDRPAELRAMLKESGLSAPCALDPAGAFASALGALATTDVFLIDSARTLLYRGAIDDQYGLGYSLDAPRHRYLAGALDALLAGGVPDVAATAAPGCLLDLPKAPSVPSTMTYHNRISRIVQANCQECHRTGGVAPFALETYEEVNAKSGMIRKMVDRGLMPPWFAAPPAPGQHSPWANDRTLADRDRADLLAWIAAGKPAGDPRDAPLARHWPAEWRIGQPDAVVQLPQPIEVKATGTMPYQNVIVETGLTEEKWMRGFEVQPTAREVVHHVLIFAQEKGASRGRGGFIAENDESRGFFAAYVPGNSFVVYPDGFAKPLPAGARLRFQIHYTPNGTATRDQMRLGMIFARERPAHVIQTTGIANHRLNIPPGADHHPETATIPVPRDVKLLSFMPHMHVRGKAFRYEAILPNGEARTLLEIPRYDFNWQLAYRYAEPPTLRAGSGVRATGWFDNSAQNPANPDPAKTVRWGPQTTDEMMLGYVEYFLLEENALGGGTAAVR